MSFSCIWVKAFVVNGWQFFMVLVNIFFAVTATALHMIPVILHLF